MQGVIGLLVSLKPRITEYLKLEGTHKDYPSLTLELELLFHPSLMEKRGK